MKVIRTKRLSHKSPAPVLIVCFLVMAVLVAADQAIKQLLATRFPNADLPLIGDYIRLYYTVNTGAAFSRMEGHMPLLIAATIVMVGVCVWLLVSRRLEGLWGDGALTLICAGGIGNLIDRIFRGYVIDYIYPKFINFAIFNFADCCVVVGAVVLCLHLILSEMPGRGGSAR